jgi:steroid 5-alpha reductase family enzyme
MGNVFALGGVVLLLLGVLLVALLGDRRSASWAPYIGVALAMLGLGVELVGAVAVSA